MRRVLVGERPDWRITAERFGFTFHSPGDIPYWDESHAYAFSLAQIELDIEHAASDIHALAMEFASRAVRDEHLLKQLAIPEAGWDAIAASWDRGDPSLYGRIDLSYDGSGPAKLLEYNADTPTALYETGVFQWLWLEACLADGKVPSGSDQFNSVHDRLIARLGKIAGTGIAAFSGDFSSVEDLGTVAYLADCAQQAGCDVRVLDLPQIGLGSDLTFRTPDDEVLATIFKLYPWEWAFRDAFGAAVMASATRFLEPPWKLILSGKGLLPALWTMAPGHPNLVPAFRADDPGCARLGDRYARKPIFGREGANTRLVRDGAAFADTDGPYGEEGFIVQALVELPNFGGRRPVLGAWIVGDEPAGLCIREGGPITDDTARFVPHFIMPH